MFESFRKFICKSCHYTGRPKLFVPGSAIAEIILWLFMVLPGVLYTIWRRSSTKWVCPDCGSADIFLMSSRIGKRLIEESKAKAA